jgi:two-component system KDP operon response regulator KdpE
MVGDLLIDLENRRVMRDGEEVHLTPNEYKLFAYLMKNAGKALTHRQLLKEVWGPAHATQTQYLRVYMVQLRHKLERDAARPRYLVTEPGVGYRLKG